VIPLFVLAHFAHHLVIALPVPLLPFIRNEFALDYTQAGVVIMAFNLAYGISQLPSGWLADRIGSRVLLTVGTAGVALAGLLVGLSQTHFMLITFLVLMGIAGGGYHPSAAPLISRSVEPKNRGRALGFHMIGGSGSFFLAPLVGAGIAACYGWRASFTWLAIPTALFGIAFYVLLGRRPELNRLSKTISEYCDKAQPPSSDLPQLIPFMVLNIFAAGVNFSVISFIPLFMIDHFGVAETIAASSLSIMYSAGLWASPLGGYISDRLGKIRVALVACLVTGPLIYLLNIVPSGLGIGAVLLMFGITMYIRQPASESYIISQTPEHRRSTILGIYYFASMEAGGIFSPIIGNCIDRFGFQPTFTGAGIAILMVSLVCAIFLRHNRD